MPEGSVTVLAPATSANLGPGFDTFGLALELRNRFTARLADSWSVRVDGEGAGRLSTGPDNIVALAMARVFAEAGCGTLAAAIECENRIPAGEGLGSSAAAIAGGMLLADRLCGTGLGFDRLLELASDMEGHPDNVACALLGGFTIAWHEGRPYAKRIEPAAGLAAVVVTAERPLATTESRSLLPAEVPHGDAAFNAARAGALVAGIALGDEAFLAAGLADRIHEPHRRSAVPDLEQVRAALIDAGAAGAVLSGAGPTVIGLVCAGDDRAALDAAACVAAALAPHVESLPGRCAPRVLGIARTGAFFE